MEGKHVGAQYLKIAYNSKTAYTYMNNNNNLKGLLSCKFLAQMCVLHCFGLSEGLRGR